MSAPRFCGKPLDTYYGTPYITSHRDERREPMNSIIQRARDLGAKFEQRHESFSYCPNYWYTQHPQGELHETKEDAAKEYIELVTQQ
jgi:hypothetical protein